MDSEAGLTQGYLFADLRGYSQFSERHGDAAAARLLARYRAIMRAVIAASGGAEIRTEGDSFYVVFRSASQAVRAGLQIVAASAADAPDHPDAPISVGVGIHAGEAIDSDEGPIGSVVNIAARICAAAKSGEVLVSDTVRSLTRTSIEASFVSRGRPRLKGIDEPIELFAVSTRGSERRHGRWRPPMRTAAATVVVLGVVAIATGAAILDSGRWDQGAPGRLPGPGVTESSHSSVQPAAATGTAEPLRLGELPAGDYVTKRFKPRLHLRMPGGWRVLDEIEGRIILAPTALPAAWRMIEGGALFLTSGQVVIGPISAGWSDCGGAATLIGPTSRDVLDWLGANPLVRLGNIEPVPMNDRTAIRVRVEAIEDCGGINPNGDPLLEFVSSRLPESHTGGRKRDGILLVEPGMKFDLYLIDMQPQSLNIAVLTPAEAKDAVPFQQAAGVLIRAMSVE